MSSFAFDCSVYALSSCLAVIILSSALPCLDYQPYDSLGRSPPLPCPTVIHPARITLPFRGRHWHPRNQPRSDAHRPRCVGSPAGRGRKVCRIRDAKANQRCLCRHDGGLPHRSMVRSRILLPSPHFTLHVFTSTPSITFLLPTVAIFILPAGSRRLV